MSGRVYRCTLMRARPGTERRFTCSEAELGMHLPCPKDHAAVAQLEVGGTYTDELDDTWERLS